MSYIDVETVKENKTFEVIEKYKADGIEGVCISTKSLGDILIKINNVNLLVSSNCVIERNKPVLEQVENYLKHKCHSCKFEVVKFENLSTVECVNSQYIKLDNFWSIQTSGSVFEDKEICISKIISIRDNQSKYWTLNKNFALNTDEIISMQPVQFTSPERPYRCTETIDGWYSSGAIKVSKEESKALEEKFINPDYRDFKVSVRK